MNQDVESPQVVKSLRVLTVTPVGLEGRGGIDRLNSYFEHWRRESASDVYCDYLGSRGGGGSLVWPINFILALFKFSYALALNRFDVVHIHVSTDGSAFWKYFFGRISALFKTPYVIHYHGMMSDEIVAANPLWLKALKGLARRATRVILLGEFFRPYFENVLAVKTDRIHIIRNGVPDAGSDAVIPRPASEVTRILFAGEVGERKGVDVLIDAIAHMDKGKDRFVCTIAGNGDIDRWSSYADQKGLSSNVQFTGWVSSSQVQSLARVSDIIILPSRAEALPLSLIEGASAGAALIATDIGAVREIVHDGVNGVIVARDSGRLSTALLDLADNPERLSAMQSASREIYLAGFNVPVYGAAVAACLRGAASKSN